ncbi:NAD(P)H-dependent oxidoreductase [Alphaproteobacteria bacterium]|nr:NAD(P)H-dependent oxidoreductase [Alphaproteobacteria bacterium]
MKVYMIVAHPENNSFNSSIANAQKNVLIENGYKVRFSNLYKDNFNPLLTRKDFKGLETFDLVQFPKAQNDSHINNKVNDEVLNEQKNLLWADILILQFPMWLYGMPAILKGWCEKVLSEGFAHKPSDNIWFEKGKMSNKKLLLSITTNGKRESFSSRGRHGSMDIILWPILNSFWFSGFKILEPLIAYNVVKCSNLERQKFILKAETTVLNIKNRNLLEVHSLDDYNKDGTLKNNIKTKTSGQQKPDNLIKQK